jgi:hypothetical protein
MARTEFINDQCKAQMLNQWSLVDWHNWIQKAKHPAQLNAALIVIAGKSGKRDKSLSQHGAKWRLIKDLIHERRQAL